MIQYTNSEQRVIVEMDDKVPTLCDDSSTPKEMKKKSGFCIEWTKIFNSPLGMLIIGLLLGFGCGIFVVCNMRCEVEKHTDLTITSNLTNCLQLQTPSQRFDKMGMHNVTTVSDESSHLNLDAVLQGIFNLLQVIEGIDKSIPPYPEGGVTMLRKELQDVIYQLEYDVKKASEHIRELQESLKSKPRRRPPP